MKIVLTLLAGLILVLQPVARGDEVSLTGAGSTFVNQIGRASCRERV